MAAVNPTDAATVDSLVVVSPRGAAIDLTTSFSQMSIYESLFTPGIICEVEFLDDKDILGSAVISGDETVYIKMTQPMGSTKYSTEFLLHLENISDVTSVGSQKGKMYTLTAISIEVMFSKTNAVEKAYSDLCSNIVQDIHKNYLTAPSATAKPIVVEQTRGVQDLLVAHELPFQAVSMVRRRAASAENKSSTYLYFENRDTNSGKQQFNFVTFEHLFKKDVVSSYKQTDAINISAEYALLNNYSNILSYKVSDQFSTGLKVILGGRREVVTFNSSTLRYESKIIDTDTNNYVSAGSNSLTSKSFIDKFLRSPSPPRTQVLNDISQRASTYIAESIADRQAYYAMILQNSLKVTVAGNCKLTAGAMVNASIPNKQAFTDSSRDDKLLTGKFLITRIRHRFGNFQDTPRYTCVVELVKGKYQEDKP